MKIGDVVMNKNGYRFQVLKVGKYWVRVQPLFSIGGYEFFPLSIRKRKSLRVEDRQMAA